MARVKARIIGCRQFIPGDERGEFDPTVVIIECGFEGGFKSRQWQLVFTGRSNHGARFLG